MESRIKRIFSNTEEKIDAFLVANSEHPNLDANFSYVSKTQQGVFEHCYIVAYKNGNGTLMTSQLEEPIARKETKLDIVVFKTRDDRKNSLKQALSKVKKLGINGNNLTYRQYKYISKLTKAKIVDISEAFSKTRSIKDKDEIKSISQACKISSKVADEFPDYIKENITEKQLSKKLVELQYNYGADDLAFSPPIVCFGKNSADPHHSPSDRKLKMNEFVLIDFGARYKGYCSDITRTFVFGKPSQKMKEMYDTVLGAQLKTVDIVKSGANGKEIDKVARNMINEKFKDRFIHSLGHEVGLTVHDGGSLSYQKDFELKENMVITIEPGVYIPEIGGVRIEDTVLVKGNKSNILTKSSKELIEL
ncbi:MAG: aminopeptidase P family protein [Candidatus Aenigmarchaeota archaeon]|nr:aminopeptidase P family protein [Candidatus Aenigmarchaeota archaeon]